MCQKKYCGKPNIPGNADITSMDFYCGDTIAYTCNTGEWWEMTAIIGMLPIILYTILYGQKLS